MERMLLDEHHLSPDMIRDLRTVSVILAQQLIAQRRHHATGVAGV